MNAPPKRTICAKCSAFTWTAPSATDSEPSAPRPSLPS